MTGAADEWSDERFRDLLARLHRHIAAMAPHQKHRAGAQLIMESIDALEELRRRRLLCQLS